MLITGGFVQHQKFQQQTAILKSYLLTFQTITFYKALFRQYDCSYTWKWFLLWIESPETRSLRVNSCEVLLGNVGLHQDDAHAAKCDSGKGEKETRHLSYTLPDQANTLQRPAALINTRAKILNKILANRLQHIKSKQDFISGRQGQLSIHKSVAVTLPNNRRKKISHTDVKIGTKKYLTKLNTVND